MKNNTVWFLQKKKRKIQNGINLKKPNADDQSLNILWIQNISLFIRKIKNTSGAILRNGSRGLVSALSAFQVIPSSDSCFPNIETIYTNNNKAVAFLCPRGVLCTSVICPSGDKPCEFWEDKHLWRYSAFNKIPKTKKRKYCSSPVSDYKGTFLCGTHIPAWKIVLYFVNHFLSHLWDHTTIFQCLGFFHKQFDWLAFLFARKCVWLGLKTRSRSEVRRLRRRLTILL